MSNTISSSSLGGGVSAANVLARVQSLSPEPKSRLRNVFNSVLRGVTQSVAEVGGNTISIDPQYAALIERQIDVQEQMQAVSMTSNIEKSKHESQMAAIRNVRAS